MGTSYQGLPVIGDLDVVAAALAGHSLIAEALNLDPDPLTTSYQEVERGYVELNETVHVAP